MATAFDTLKFTDRLIASGVSQEQARAQVEALQEALQNADVATKHDLHELRHHMDLKFTRIDGKIDGLRFEMDAKFSEMDAKFSEMDAKFSGMDAKFSEIDAKFSEMDARVDGKIDNLRVTIESVKTDILKWVTGLILTQIVAVTALVKLLP